MRLICTIDSVKTEENPDAFSYFLSGHGIDNSIEEVSETTFHIWITDEDDVREATAFYTEYQKNPRDPQFQTHYEEAVAAQEKVLPEAPPKRRRFFSPAPYGPVSIIILLTVVSLFLWAQLQRGSLMPPAIPGIVQAPMLAPIERALIYDYPTYFEKRDELYTLYTPKDIEEKKTAPPEARQLISQLRATPTWMGIYDRVVRAIRVPEATLAYDGPLFQKISQGQVWRTITPILLHFDLLHIFFNVLWFILLGNQIEFRLGAFRYLLLILLTAIFSNTAQYLMSGPFFMGLSGVVCGMAAFIFARQQVAPWEGYLLHRFTLIFLAIFVIGMFALQLVFFFLQIFSSFQLSIGIANTAHIVGALVGYLLGRLRLFSIHHKVNK